MASVISALSTTTALGIFSTWTSSYASFDTYVYGDVTARTDTNSRLIIDYSMDGVNIDSTLTQIVSSSGEGNTTLRIYPKTRYVRVTITNDIAPSAQAITRVQTIFYNYPQPAVAVADSYCVCSQSFAATGASAFITATSTTVAITSDWTNSGTGTYTYTGSTPRRFIVTIYAKFNGMTSSNRRLKTVIGSLTVTPADGDNLVSVCEITQKGNETNLSNSATSQPFVLTNTATIRIFMYGVSISGASCSLVVGIHSI